MILVLAAAVKNISSAAEENRRSVVTILYRYKCSGVCHEKKIQNSYDKLKLESVVNTGG